MPDKFTTARADSPLAFGSDAVPYTPADADLPINVKAVRFTEETTITFKNAAGTARTNYPVSVGLLDFIPARITAVASGLCYLIV